LRLLYLYIGSCSLRLRLPRAGPYRHRPSTRVPVLQRPGLGLDRNLPSHDNVLAILAQDLLIAVPGRRGVFAPSRSPEGVAPATDSSPFVGLAIAGGPDRGKHGAEPDLLEEGPDRPVQDGQV
jgi:hypothetical protein